jgi:hypothetical protein
MQAKSTDELLCRLIEERDGKKLDATSVNLSSSFFAVSFTQINPHTSGPSAGVTSMSNPSARTMNHFHSRTTIEGSAPTFGMLQQTTYSCKGTRTPRLAFLCQTLVRSHISPGTPL